MSPLLLADADTAIGIVAIGGCAVVAIVYTIANAIRREAQSAYNARLKQMMIERGMSADEIARVISSGEGRPPKKGDWC